MTPIIPAGPPVPGFIVAPNHIAIPIAPLIGSLLRTLVASPPTMRHQRREPLWVAVRDMLCVGSTYACVICREYGHDPELQIRMYRR